MEKETSGMCLAVLSDHIVMFPPRKPITTVFRKLLNGGCFLLIYCF